MNGCETCAFDYDSVAPETVAAGIHALLPRQQACVRTAAKRGLVRQRPDLETWSILEYACHLRDVLEVQHGRIIRACHEEVPRLPSMGRDDLAATRRYAEQAPDEVLDALAANAAVLSDLLDGITPEQWSRTALYPYGEVAERSVAWIARHTLHEMIHHLADMERGLADVSIGS